MGKAPDFVSVLDLSMPQRDLVLNIMRDVANEVMIDFSRWNVQRKSCEIIGVELGYEVIDRKTQLVLFHPDYGKRPFNPDSVSAEHVMRLILRWLRREPDSVEYGPPEPTQADRGGAKAHIQLRSIRGH